MDTDNRITILQFNYWEHFKTAKDLSYILPPEHKRRVELTKSMDEILSQINAETQSHTTP